jgi:hypothetical protein
MNDVLQEHIYLVLAKHEPHPAHEARLRAVAGAWAEEVDKIIGLMFRYTKQARQRPWSASVREEAIYELTKLMFWLGDLVVKKKLEERAIDVLDPESEKVSASSSTSLERIENTARILADNIWIKKYDHWHRHSNRIVRPDNTGTRLRRSKVYDPTKEEQFTRKNHYSPDFSNKYWSDANGDITIYSRKVDGNVHARRRSFGKWGYEFHLYPQWLEAYLSHIESEAKVPYEKLLNTIPLNQDERQRWVTFLIAQTIRTPSFIGEALGGLKKIIEARQLPYPTHPEYLVRAFASLFQSDEFYTWAYGSITTREWQILRAGSGSSFIKPDQPTVLDGNQSDNSWTLLYPLSPTKCFLVGPDPPTYPIPVVPRSYDVKPEDTDSLNKVLADNALKEVITIPSNDSPGLRILLERSLGNKMLRRDWTRQSAKPYWGKLKQS